MTQTGSRLSTGRITRRRPQLVLVLVCLVGAALWGEARDPGLVAVDPWIQVNMPVAAGDTAVLGFFIENRGYRPITIVRGISDSLPEATFEGLWIGEIAGHMSGSTEHVANTWYTGYRGEFPVQGEGYTLHPGAFASLTFVYTVTEVGTYTLEAPLGATISSGWLGLQRRWIIREFERLVLEASLEGHTPVPR